jgi:hypothetical protein
MFNVQGLSKNSYRYLERHRELLKGAGIQNTDLSKAFAEGNLLKKSAGGHALEARVKNSGELTKALLAASKADRVKSNLGPTVAKKTIGELNQLLPHNPHWGALLTPRAAIKVKRDIFKLLEVYFEGEIRNNRDSAQKALGEHKSSLERVLFILQESHRFKKEPKAQEFVRRFEKFQDDPAQIELCLDLLKEIHPFGEPPPLYRRRNNDEPPTYDESEERELGDLAQKMRSSLAMVKESRRAMEEAVVFHDIYSALRETQRNPSYRWLAARISPEMRGHIAAGFGIFGVVTLILSFPLMVGPLRDMFDSWFHRHNNQQQQQGP